MELITILEGLLFAAREPLAASAIQTALKEAAELHPEAANGFDAGKVSVTEIEAALSKLAEACNANGRGVELRQIAGGYQLRTAPALDPWIAQLTQTARPGRLTPAALETLAIIAYRQPITRAQVESIRGVAVDGVLASLLDRDLVMVAGRADAPGRPQLYVTTAQFLEAFGLKDLHELPQVEELRWPVSAEADAQLPLPVTEE